MSLDQSSDSQSSGGGRKRQKQPKPHAIPFMLHKGVLDKRQGLGSFHLEMPSDLEDKLFDKKKYPLLLFDMKDDDQLESLKMMKSLPHENVLRLYAIDEAGDKTIIQAYVEPYRGVLSRIFLEDINSVVNDSTKLVPSVYFQDIVSQIVDGLDYIRENGYYHGNFSWDTTYFIDQKTKPTIKLANFERKGSKPLLECQGEDWVSLGFALEEISQQVKEGYHPLGQFTCDLIDDLSHLLKSVTTESLSTIKQEIKAHLFFWDERRRKSFFTIEVLGAWDHPTVQAHFTNSLSMPAMPWTSYRYDGYLDEMETYRVENDYEEYNKKSWKDFLRCISGMYTHQSEFKKKQPTVDSVIQSRHPRLCFDLKAAMAVNP